MFILYFLIIFPVIQLIELCYLFVYRVFNNPGIAVMGVSVAVSICTLPLYFYAEKLQQKERALQNLMKPKIDKIKDCFRGDERYMVLSAYYRQNQYHPIYALRNVFGLLIQIPFFIAAYSYLSQLEALQGTSFFIIRDLGKPDALLPLGSLHINILPILMTLINVISGIVYAKGFELKDKLQLYGMSLVFLLLLYNSPSGLVLYWTMNNIFSLAKNLLQKTKYTKTIICALLFTSAFFLDIFVLFIHHGYWLKRVLVCISVSVIFFIPLFVKYSGNIRKKIYTLLVLQNPDFWRNRLFILCALVLFLLAGFVIPSSVIASSVAEFSFIESYSSPIPFILHTALRAAGIFLFWPFCIYYLFSTKTRIGLTICIMALGFAALINAFSVSENFGFLTNTLIFSEPKPIFAHYNSVALNIIIIFLSLLFLSAVLLSKRKKILFSVMVIAVASLAGLGIFNLHTITKEYLALREQKKTDANVNSISPVYTLSVTGKNILFIMIDTTVSGYIPFIFEEKPELYPAFSGFTWYPNCSSFAGHTLVGAPPLYGGYEYTPEAVNKRDTVTLFEKHKEAYLLLPLLFSEAGYSATVTDPPFDNYQTSNTGIFSDYPQIHVENIRRAYSAYWNQTHPDASGMLVSGILENTLIRFSFFKISPLAFRLFIYDDGEWLTTAKTGSSGKTRGGLTTGTIDDYVLLDILPDLTTITHQDTGTFTMIYSHLPHSPAFLQFPDYVPSQTASKMVSGRGNGPFADEEYYHVTMASFLLLGKYFSFLKENGVYDNTRIIIVADHGTGSVLKNYEKNISLPNGGKLSLFNPVLMVKDFYNGEEESSITVDETFMTNADAPFLALKNIIDHPVNPFTGIPLQSNKENGIDLVTIGALNSHDHSKYQYRVGKNQWLFVKDNIFDPANWKAVSK